MNFKTRPAVTNATVLTLWSGCTTEATVPERVTARSVRGDLETYA
jgi:hypothetical protein